MMTLSEADPLRMVRIWKTTPVRDGLECYFRILQQEAKADLMHGQLLYVQGGLKKAPKMPDILKMRTRKRRKPGGPKTPVEKPEFLKRLEERE